MKDDDNENDDEEEEHREREQQQRAEQGPPAGGGGALDYKDLKMRHKRRRSDASLTMNLISKVFLHLKFFKEPINIRENPSLQIFQLRVNKLLRGKYHILKDHGTYFHRTEVFRKRLKHSSHN